MKNGKKIGRFLWFAFLFTMLWLSCIPLQGCRAVKPVVVTEKVTETVTETVHDTVFKTEKDTSLYRALLECQNGKVVIKEVAKAQAGKYLNAPKVKIANNNLDVDCEARAQELFAQWKSTHRATEQIKEVPVIIEKPLTWWQVIQIWIGRIVLLILFIWLLKTIYNPAKFLSNGK